MNKEHKHPEITVILPFFNAENTLEKAVQSILNQTFQDFELLLIDNNSSDKSHEIAGGASLTDSRVRLFKESKQGVVHAMNRGLAMARGSFIARMDADDISREDRLEKQLEFLRAKPGIDLVGSRVKYIPHNKNTAGFSRFVDWANSFLTPEEIDRKRFVEIPVVNPTLLFRRELYHQFGGCLDGNFPEDYEMQLRYLSKGAKMAKLPEELIEWHDYATRLTRTDERYSTEAFFQTKASYFRIWSEKHNPFHPNIWVWGAGRKTRKRCHYLTKEGLKVNGFIDIVKEKKDTSYYKDLPGPGSRFIVSMVTNAGAGEQISAFLLERNYREGQDFILMG